MSELITILYSVFIPFVCVAGLFMSVLFSILIGSLIQDLKEYKKNREIQPDWFYVGINMIELITKYYRDNSVIYRVQNVEADDFVAPLIDNYINEHDKVLMFSTDFMFSFFRNHILRTLCS